MPINATYEFGLAEKKFYDASTFEEKLKALQEMLSTAPSHKGSENLRDGIKRKISKYKFLIKKEKQSKKGKTKFSIKKEGVATVCLVGTTNSGKSTLLKKLTGAKVEIAPYQFTTKKPEMGVMDYYGMKIQIIEIPAIFEGFSKSENGPSLLSLVRGSDLMVWMFNTPSEKEILDRELDNVKIPKLIISSDYVPDQIWKSLNLIKIYTKQPGKKKDYPPIALEKGRKIKDIVSYVHKDFLTKFRFARVWGKSAKFEGQSMGLDHKLEDNDIVEIHLK